MLVLMLTLVLGVNGAIEINVLLPSANASIDAGLNGGTRCEHTLEHNVVSLDMREYPEGKYV